jgi:hypothetical protein
MGMQMEMIIQRDVKNRKRRKYSTSVENAGVLFLSLMYFI